ncbi:NADH-quinone oxidoreductase subunit J family protein [Geopsychrobacter electrodiphilus]|uniref:NADH-quinone oxidoreductase subunit J family protein n=1 Tax=Geopsychrobacter electrodiphilus TaxID=225196 RepID=UPI00037CBC49|nr:NADH-quinone oxidoreductase subunit J [Geopsychrobacter electrodiphilus]
MLSILFYLFAVVAIFSAFYVTKARSPVNSALCLVTTFICFAVLYITLDAPFMAAIQIMVYAGAIMVLIVFVIMLLNLGTAVKKRYTHGLAWGGALSILMLFITNLFIRRGVPTGKVGEITTQTIHNYGHTELIGRAMFTDFLLPFEIASILLLVAIVGAVILSKREV